MSTGHLRIGINATLSGDGSNGGVEQVLIGLISSLGALPDGNEQYVILTAPGGGAWLKEYLGPNQSLHAYPSGPDSASKGRRLLLRLGETKYGERLKAIIRTSVWPDSRSGFCVYPPPPSDGFIESLGLHVVHFPYQNFVRTAIPTVYNPHDLQHLHYPFFFSPEAVAQRVVYMQYGLQHSSFIAVASGWVKSDIMMKYNIDPEKVQVIPLAPPTQVYSQVSMEEVRQVALRFHLPAMFVLYPAQTWPHKNHLRLLRAIAYLRDQMSLRVNLVCTGTQSAHWKEIAQEIHRLDLSDQVRFLGYVTASTLRAVYRLAHGVVIPTLFEAGSFPLFEAFAEGVPTACSSVTSLPEQAGGGALLFDPYSVQDIALAVKRIMYDDDLRLYLKDRAAAQSVKVNWETTARTYRALYRKAAGCLLDSHDLQLLGNRQATVAASNNVSATS